MMKCVEKKSFGTSLYFAVEKNMYDEVHGYIINLLKEMGFHSSYLNEKVDISFESVSDFYLPLFTEFGIIEIFVGKDLVHLAFHFKNEEFKKKYLPFIRKYFDY